MIATDGILFDGVGRLLQRFAAKGDKRFCAKYLLPWMQCPKSVSYVVS